MSIRRACREGLTHLRRHARTLELVKEMQRGFASLPEDISQAASKARFPPRRNATPPPGSFASSAEAITPQAAQAPIDVAKEGARIGEFNFPRCGRNIFSSSVFCLCRF